MAKGEVECFILLMTTKWLTAFYFTTTRETENTRSIAGGLEALFSYREDNVLHVMCTTLRKVSTTDKIALE